MEAVSSHSFAGKLSHTYTHSMRGQLARGRNKLSAGMCLAGCTQSASAPTKQILKKTIPESKTHKFTKSMSCFDISQWGEKKPKETVTVLLSFTIYSL